MSYLGDYAEDYATLNFKFTTRTTTGVPTTLAGSPVVKVYKANATDSEIAVTTLSVDFDTVTGLNNVLIDLSANALYTVGNDYHVVITAGTVGGASVVGEVVAQFSIENRFDEVDVVKLSGGTDEAGRLKGALNTGDYIDANTILIGGTDPDLQMDGVFTSTLEAFHLDHLFKVTYNPAAKPGVADALLNELIEDDGGVARYTANALEQAPDTTTGLVLSGLSAVNAGKLEDMLDGTGATFTASIVGNLSGSVNSVATEVTADMVKIHGSALTETSGLLAAAFTKFFNVATPTGTVGSIPDAVPGASGGLFIAGTNAATAITTALTANIIGNITGDLSGSVGTLTGHTNQSGDSYAIVSSGTYGNAKLVRSTTPGNTLDVSATGEAGLDFNNIKDATGAHTLTNITIPITTAITDEVSVDVTKIGGSTQRATDLAEISQYLIANAATLITVVADDSIIAQMLAANGDISDYDDTTDSQEAIRNAISTVTVIGEGAIEFTVTVNDGGGNPIDGVEVWISSDAGGSAVVAGTLTTDAVGEAVFMLDAATYYLWKQRSGYNFTNPETIVVS